jgi:zinc transport system substrate-binding protein
LLVVALLGAIAAARPGAAGEEVLHVWVSILPQTEIVDRVGGEQVTVQSLVQPGHSPTTYEPTPRQLAALWEADLLVRIGVPFERTLLAKMASIHPELRVVDSSSGIELAPMAEAHDGHDHGSLDPHIWLDPSLVKVQAATVRNALCELVPADCAQFDLNLAAYQAELDAVDLRVRSIVQPVVGRTLHVFHPAYGYFARRYGLRQQAVETSGKEPTPRQMAAFVEEARRSGARVLFVQPQFLGGGASAAAEAMGARLVELDPLAPDLAANLERMATRIAAGWEQP